MSPNYDREYWVYRAFDENDVLLYVGCTSDRKARRQAHRRESPWFPYATRFHQTGPFEKAAGFATEKAVILVEAPLFNSKAGDQGHNRSVDRLAAAMRDARRERWEAEKGREMTWQEFVPMGIECSELAEAQLGPRITWESRLADYLRTRQQVAS